MKFLANENVPRASSEYMTVQGYDIVHIGLVSPSISDEEVMALAIEEDRIIITFDRDYGILVFRNGYKPPGVIYLRIQDYSPSYPGEFLHSVISMNTFTFEGHFTVIDEKSIRQRKIE